MKKGVEVRGVFISEKRYCLLQNVVNQLLKEGYQTKKGLKIEDDDAFKELQRIAEDQVNEPYFIFCYDKYPKVGLLKLGLLDHAKPFWESLPFYAKWIWMRYVRKINRSIHIIDSLDRYFSVAYMAARTPEEKENGI